MAKEIKNIAASVRERLRNISVESGKDFQSIIRQFIQERFLYRLSISIYSNSLILKGALLLLAYDISRLRPTKDIDFLGNSLSNDKDDLANIIKEILKLETGDGLLYDHQSVESENIVEDGDYHGVRIKFNAYLGNIKERIQIDIGFGDKIIAGPVIIDFPVLLDFPAPKLKVYSIESAIAEKFEAIVSLQLLTSRMKDFYDITFLADNYKIDKDILKEAIVTTFKNRGTDLELRKNIFSDKFINDEQKQKYWLAFLNRHKLTAEKIFSKIVVQIKNFIEPLFEN